MFLRRKPDERAIEQFLVLSAGTTLSYAPVGLAERGGPGFILKESSFVVGNGDAAWNRAKGALAAWRHFEVGWIELFPVRASIAPGTDVAVLIRHLGFWSLNGCRVVYHLDEQNGTAFGFAYGTLTTHAECGEERFEVRFDAASGDVTYVIRAASRPRSLLALIGSPVAVRLQARFFRDSGAAMRRAVAGVGAEPA
jgi:uncharacterized protein (UPF0548 family)